LRQGCLAGAITTRISSVASGPSEDSGHCQAVDIERKQDVTWRVNRLGIIHQSLKATDIETLPHPGFPHMRCSSWLTNASHEGNSLIKWKQCSQNRLRYRAELNRMGQDIRVSSNAIVRECRSVRHR